MPVTPRRVQWHSVAVRGLGGSPQWVRDLRRLAPVCACVLRAQRRPVCWCACVPTARALPAPRRRLTLALVGLACAVGGAPPRRRHGLCLGCLVDTYLVVGVCSTECVVRSNGDYVLHTTVFYSPSWDSTPPT